MCSSWSAWRRWISIPRKSAASAVQAINIPAQSVAVNVVTGEMQLRTKPLDLLFSTTERPLTAMNIGRPGKPVQIYQPRNRLRHVVLILF